MSVTELEILKANVGRQVIIRCTDGEVIVAEINSVGEEAEEVIYDVIYSNRPDDFRDAGNYPAYSIRFSDVASVEVPREQTV